MHRTLARCGIRDVVESPSTDVVIYWDDDYFLVQRSASLRNGMIVTPSGKSASCIHVFYSGSHCLTAYILAERYEYQPEVVRDRDRRLFVLCFTHSGTAESGAIEYVAQVYMCSRGIAKSVFAMKFRPFSGTGDFLETNRISLGVGMLGECIVEVSNIVYRKEDDVTKHVSASVINLYGYDADRGSFRALSARN